MSDTEKTETTTHQVEDQSRESSNPSPSTDDRYAILMETSGEECESWYYFIKYNKNKKNLQLLNKQLEEIDWYVLDDLSTFDLELEYLVSAQTAKEMTKVDLNHTAHHRKFDGKLKRVDIKFKKKDTNEKKMTRVFEVIGYGQIEDYIDHEDLDEDDLTEEDKSSIYEDIENPFESSEEEGEEEPERIRGGIPPALLNSHLPRYAKAKQHRRKKH